MADGEVRSINVDDLMVTAIKALYPEVRKRYEDKIEAVQALPEVHVLAGLSLRLYRLLLTAEALAGTELLEESNATLRSAAESITNLMYIMDVGEQRPQETKKSPELAEMFIAYGDVSYYKLLKGRGERSRTTFKKREGWTDAQVDAHAEDCRQKRDAALALGCTKTSWHPLGLTTMATHVLLHLPDYADKRFAELLLSCFASGNSATHGDALFLRTHYRGTKARPLEVKFAPDLTNLNGIAAIVSWAWKRLARYFGDQEWMDKAIANEVRRLAKERWNAAPPADAPRVLRLSES